MSEMWVERHRPKSVVDIKGQETIVERLGAYSKSGSFPHLMFSGPPGTGKTTAALALTRDVFGENFRNNLLEMNASDERKLESIRTKVKQFARTVPLPGTKFKAIFLDEADALTSDAQGALRRIMEQYADTCRFILSCNYSSKIIEAIQSRCAVFRFRPLEENKVFEMILQVAESEDVEIESDAAMAIAQVSLGDLRKAITSLQVASSLGPRVTREMVYETTATAPPEDLREFFISCKEYGFRDSRMKMKEIQDKYGLAGTDLVNQLHRELENISFIENEKKLEITEIMAEADFRMVEGGGENLQLDSMTARICILVSS